MIQHPKKQITQTDADDQPRHQQTQVRFRPGGRFPVAQAEQVHGDKQRRQQPARRDGVHHQRQQRNPDYREAAAKGALHEADQEYPGESGEESGDGQVQSLRSLHRGREMALISLTHCTVNSYSFEVVSWASCQAGSIKPGFRALYLQMCP